MSLRLVTVVGLMALAAPAFSQTSSCDPNTGAGCITDTLSVTNVDVGAGTLTGLNGSGATITAQITPATIFKPPNPNCAPSDPFYPWQQLVFAGANSFDPSRHAFLGQLAGWNQKPPSPNHPPNPNFNVTLDAYNTVFDITPTSCTGL